MIGYFLLGGLFGAILGYAISDLMNLYDKERRTEMTNQTTCNEMRNKLIAIILTALFYYAIAKYFGFYTM